MGLSCTVSELEGDFRRKLQNFPTPCILGPTAGLPVGIGYRRMVSKKLQRWGYQAEQEG